MREILLTQGKVALVDDADYEWLNQFKWQTSKAKHLFYAIRTIGTKPNQKIISMHSVILGTPKGMQTDHINHDGLDNRRSNLRLCTSAENQYNQRIQSRNKSSKFKGVYWNIPAGKWLSRICVNGVRFYLGCFNSEVEAAEAYDNAAKKHFGDFSELNFVA